MEAGNLQNIIKNPYSITLVQVHDKNQSKYMIHLLAGVGAMGVSLVAFSQMVFMNATPKHLMK